MLLASNDLIVQEGGTTDEYSKNTEYSKTQSAGRRRRRRGRKGTRRRRRRSRRH